MLKLILGAALVLCLLPQPAQAAVIDVGINPTSGTGAFSNNVGGGQFNDYITFQLVGGPQFVAFASATNDYILPTDFITTFTGQLFDQVGAPGGGDDIPVNPLVNAVPCQQNPGGCQVLAGFATLNAGDYYLEIAGIGGGSSGYGGNITTAQVPGPIVGAGLPGLLMALAGFFGWRRFRRG